MMSEIVQSKIVYQQYFTMFCQVLQWISELVLQLTRSIRDVLYTKFWILTKAAHKTLPGIFPCLLP